MNPPREPPRKTRPLTAPLRDMPVYRPAPYLALFAILLPIVAASAASVALLKDRHHVPIWVPLLILLFIPVLTVAWLFMRSVRLSPVGISVGRPFQRWHEANWNQIARVERRWLIVRVYTDRGDRISFAPRLLMDGKHLLRLVLNFLPPQVLDGALRREALDQLPVPEADITGILRARPRNRWPLSGFSLALAGLFGAALALTQLPPPFSWALSVIGILIALLGIAIALWLLQEVIVTTEGLTIIRPWRRAADEVMWHEVRVLDHSPHWALLRFRVGRSVRCVGPALLRAPERDLMTAFINRYCTQYGVITYQHRGLF